MPQGSGQFPKSSGDKIFAGDFNRIWSTVSNILSTVTGYGVLQSNDGLNPGEFITFNDFNLLTSDVRTIYGHQFNVDINTITPNLPAVGALIDSDFVNSLTNYASVAWQDINSGAYTVHPSQLAVQTTVTTRTLAWDGTLRHSNIYSFANQEYSINHAFNLGGYFGMKVGYNNSTGSADDLAWVSFLDSQVKPAVNALTYTRSDFVLSAVKTVTGTSGGDSFTATIDVVNGDQIRSVLYLKPASGRLVNLDVTSTSSYYYSTNAGPVPGILGPLPVLETTGDFNDSGATIRLTPNVSSLSFTAIEDTQTSVATIRITNFGTQAGDIISANYGSYGDIFATGAPSPVASFPITLAPGASQDFTVSYFSANIGTYTPSIQFVVNTDPIGVTPTTGTVVVSVNAVFTIDQLIASASPTPVTLAAATRLESPQQLVNITSNRPYTFVPSIDTLYPANFQIVDQTANSVGIKLLPGSLANPGSYTATLNLNITDTLVGDSTLVSVPVTGSLTFPADYNIGNWQSAGAKNNSIVGASYDLIGGIKTITLGFAAGADDNSNELGTGPTYMTPIDLNFSQDDKFSAVVDGQYQKVMYGGVPQEVYNGFLNNNGVWIRYPTDYGPVNVDMFREFKLQIPQTGEYFWQFNVDNTGAFYIDNNLVSAADLRIFSTTNYSANRTGSLGTLTAGEHSIKIQFNNSDGPAAVALEITDSADRKIWSLTDYVRTNPTPYRFWREVYRIPFPNSGNGVAVTANSANFLIKDYSPVFGNSFGSYFGTPGTASAGSMFTVTDDGFGNMNITVNQLSTTPPGFSTWVTLNNATLSPYYYSEADVEGRFYNLEEPFNNNQTRFFTGFNNDGNTQTVIVTYPTVPNSYPGTGGGGGGGGSPPSTYFPGFDWYFDPATGGYVLLPIDFGNGPQL